jgi:hypothetical protein
MSLINADILRLNSQKWLMLQGSTQRIRSIKTVAGCARGRNSSRGQCWKHTHSVAVSAAAKIHTGLSERDINFPNAKIRYLHFHKTNNHCAYNEVITEPDINSIRTI